MADTESLIALSAILLASAWASGLNLYAVLLVLGIGGLSGNIDLPTGLEALQHPFVIMLVGCMYLVEFGADKIPGVDSAWDVLHTFIRVPAGALLIGAFVADIDADWLPLGYTLGGFLALVSHLTKSSLRLLINTSPEPFTNWGASLSEDILVFFGLWLAFTHPIAFLVMLALFIGLVIWLIPKIFQLIGKMINGIRGWFARERERQA